MDALTVLRLQIEWGADEAIGDEPVNRLGLPGSVPIRRIPASSPSPRIIIQSPAHGSDTITTPRKEPLVPPPARRAEDIAATCQTVDELRAALAVFDGCSLSITATNLVFSDGNPDADLMIVGEGPGAEEDRAGKPFVGPSGQFLDRMLGSIGVDRTQVLITNLIPWRPPGNRNPTDDEILICLPFLLRHIALVRPRHLVLLGALSSRAVLGESTGIRRLRGKIAQSSIPGLADPIPTLPMLHPAYLLRTPAAKRDAWSDLRMLKKLRNAHPTRS